jgi:hypothetical protein
MDQPIVHVTKRSRDAIWTVPDVEYKVMRWKDQRVLLLVARQPGATVRVVRGSQDVISDWGVPWLPLTLQWPGKAEGTILAINSAEQIAPFVLLPPDSNLRDVVEQGVYPIASYDPNWDGGHTLRPMTYRLIPTLSMPPS